MNKLMNMIIIACGLFGLVMLLLIYSFSTLELPKSVYIGLWCACIGLVQYASGNCNVLER